MPTRISLAANANMFGPTTGDRVRLANITCVAMRHDIMLNLTNWPVDENRV